jgi:outer membrane receptor protein involved in Fe transport
MPAGAADPMVNLAYDLTHDLHVYGKWSTGYKSGGANSRAQQYDSFNPETVSMFEIGAKTEFWQHRARFNIAAYAGTYKNIQVDFSRPYESNGVLTTRTTTSTINAPGTGGLHGVEAEFTLAPVKGLTLMASYAYTYVRIPATVNPYPNSSGVLSTLAVPIYQTYTPSTPPASPPITNIRWAAPRPACISMAITTAAITSATTIRPITARAMRATSISPRAIRPSSSTAASAWPTSR